MAQSGDPTEPQVQHEGGAQQRPLRSRRATLQRLAPRAHATEWSAAVQVPHAAHHDPSRLPRRCGADAMAPRPRRAQLPLVGLLAQEKSVFQGHDGQGRPMHAAHAQRTDSSRRDAAKVDVFTRRTQELMAELSRVDVPRLVHDFKAAVRPCDHFVDYKRFAESFSGVEAAEWFRFHLFEKQLKCSPQHAEALGNTLMQTGVFECISQELTTFSRECVRGLSVAYRTCNPWR